ncbi:unnamed protein product [Phytophthora fragariaefolia]|uniref:RxLR effector protein n=1 Tax=Phytophthora fragariaefolia TaxID=1490495 RepID=A0A9W6XZK4_9STRA|nr:unnamed protein product [Phytophthora fragariaefolia]
MSVCFLLLLAVIAVFAGSNVVSGSVIQHQASQKVIEPDNDIELKTARMLRATVKPNKAIDPTEEERGIAEIAKKLGTSVAKLPKTATQKFYVHLSSAAVNFEATATKFMIWGFNPDQVYRWLKISDDLYPTHERALWKAHLRKYRDANHGWIFKYT